MDKNKVINHRNTNKQKEGKKERKRCFTTFNTNT